MGNPRGRQHQKNRTGDGPRGGHPSGKHRGPGRAASFDPADGGAPLERRGGHPRRRRAAHRFCRGLRLCRRPGGRGEGECPCHAGGRRRRRAALPVAAGHLLGHRGGRPAFRGPSWGCCWPFWPGAAWRACWARESASRRRKRRDSPWGSRSRKDPRGAKKTEVQRKRRDTVLLLLSAAFLIGGAAGGLLASRLSPALYLSSFWDTAAQGVIQPSLWRELWVVFPLAHGRGSPGPAASGGG